MRIIKLRGQTENWLATNGADVAGQRAVATDDLLPFRRSTVSSWEVIKQFIWQLMTKDRSSTLIIISGNALLVQLTAMDFKPVQPGV